MPTIQALLLSAALYLSVAFELQSHPSANELDSPGQSKPMYEGRFEFIKEEVLYQARWLRMLKYEYLTPDGSKRTWELCERTTRAGASDAVDVLAVLEKKGEPNMIVLVKQYRPPLKGYTIEMPAGLVDQGETQETTAEETGYTGVVVRKADPVIVTDPGITNSNFQMVEVRIDGDLPENLLPKPAEEDAYIESIVLPIPGLKAELDRFVSEGLHVDSRLYHFAAGLDYASRHL